MKYIDRLRAIIQAPGYAVPESSLRLPHDPAILKGVLTMMRRLMTPHLKWIILVGIGGSNLGAKAVYDALVGHADILRPDHFPKIIFLDTLNPVFFAHLKHLLQSITSPDEWLVNVVSKSGHTLETTENFNALLGTLARFSSFHQRVVITTDFQSPLWRQGENHRFGLLAIPDTVGGRFSIFSTAGLFPLACAGIDVRALLAGARSVSVEPFQAATLFRHQKKFPIHDLFLFEPALESLGKWYRQLAAESLGKQGKGMTPTVSIGTTDLHSMAQLYLGGPNDRFTTFVWVQKITRDATGKKMHAAKRAIFEGVKTAYKKKKRPFTELLLPDMTAKSLGAFMQAKIMETMCLARMMSINAFDQPEVELYKKEARKRL